MTNYNNHYLNSMTDFETLVEQVAADPEFIATVKKNNAEWDELAAAQLEITVDELHRKMREEGVVPMRKLPHQRLHGH